MMISFSDRWMLISETHVKEKYYCFFPQHKLQLTWGIYLIILILIILIIYKVNIQDSIVEPLVGCICNSKVWTC